jgi:hypothetical protein
MDGWKCIVTLRHGPERQAVQKHSIRKSSNIDNRIIWCTRENLSMKQTLVFISSLMETENISLNKYVTKKIHFAFPAKH